MATTSLTYKLETHAVVIVNKSSKTKTKFSDFFILKKTNKVLEITATKSNHTYAKRQQMLPRLQ